MKEISLEFSPLLKLEENEKGFVIDTSFTGQENLKGVWDGNCPGVYIWGFLDPNKQEKNFIPYYVGIKVDSILNRIKKHYSNLNCSNKNSTYRRLSADYFYGRNKMLPFYNDPLYPLFINHTDENEWIIKDPAIKKKIEYTNKIDFFKIFKPDYKKSTTIKDFNKLTNKNQESYFFDKSRDDNFRFLYWDFNSMKTKTKDLNTLVNKQFLEAIESLVKFSLKGKTGSDSKTIEVAINRIQPINSVKINMKKNLHYLLKDDVSYDFTLPY